MIEVALTLLIGLGGVYAIALLLKARIQQQSSTQLARVSRHRNTESIEWIRASHRKIWHELRVLEDHRLRQRRQLTSVADRIRNVEQTKLDLAVVEGKLSLALVDLEETKALVGDLQAELTVLRSKQAQPSLERRDRFLFDSMRELEHFSTIQEKLAR